MSADKLLRDWMPVALYTGLIFWLSSSYRPIPGQEFFPQMDKVAHFTEFGPYGLLMIRAVRRSFPGLSWRRALMAALFAAMVVGAADEFYQSFVPLKSTSFLDWLSDAAGAAAGLWLYRWRTARTP